MAQTKEVRIGPLEFPVTGALAERLDAYNWDDTIFSPDDLDIRDLAEAEQQAIGVVAKAAGFSGGEFEKRMQALIDVADQATLLSQSVNRLRAFDPSYNSDGLGFLGKGEIEFTAAGWQAAGGEEAMRQVRLEASHWNDVAVRGAFVFLDDPRSSVTREYTGQVNRGYYEPFPAAADSVMPQVKEEMRSVRDFFHVEEARTRENDFCNHATDLECEGSGCPKDDEVTGNFCVPTFK